MKIKRIVKVSGAVIFIILGLISFLICTIFGLVSRHIFSFENVDIVSSVATLFAGIVALCLYTDWREQYRIDLLFKTLDSLSRNLSNFDCKFYDLKGYYKELIMRLKNVSLVKY